MRQDEKLGTILPLIWKIHNGEIRCFDPQKKFKGKLMSLKGLGFYQIHNLLGMASRMNQELLFKGELLPVPDPTGLDILAIRDQFPFRHMQIFKFIDDMAFKAGFRSKQDLQMSLTFLRSLVNSFGRVIMPFKNDPSIIGLMIYDDKQPKFIWLKFELISHRSKRSYVSLNDIRKTFVDFCREYTRRENLIFDESTVRITVRLENDSNFGYAGCTAVSSVVI